MVNRRVYRGLLVGMGTVWFLTISWVARHIVPFRITVLVTYVLAGLGLGLATALAYGHIRNAKRSIVIAVSSVGFALTMEVTRSNHANQTIVVLVGWLLIILMAGGEIILGRRNQRREHRPRGARWISAMSMWFFIFTALLLRKDVGNMIGLIIALRVVAGISIGLAIALQYGRIRCVKTNLSIVLTSMVYAVVMESVTNSPGFKSLVMFLGYMAIWSIASGKPIWPPIIICRH